MDQDKARKIKQAVRANFDASPDPYQAFEEKNGFFRTLNSAIVARMKVRASCAILDVGCGTGASSAQMLDAIEGCRVVGLDISSAMLDKARLCFPESDRLQFVEGDAANLSGLLESRFDAVVYSASIFLIPDYQESLRQAKGILTAGGELGLTFMNGLYGPSNESLFEVADRTAGEGVSMKRAVKLNEFEAFFKELFPACQSWDEDFRLPEETLREFFSIPAMSAGLFPGIPYPERVAKVGRMFDHMPDVEKIFRWRIMIGENS